MYKPKAQIVWYASSNRCAEKNKADEKNGEIGEKSGFWLDLGHFSRLQTKKKIKLGVGRLKICTNQRRKMCDMPHWLDCREKKCRGKNGLKSVKVMILTRFWIFFRIANQK